MITIYCLENCPNCNAIKQRLKKLNIQYITEQMDSAESITELRVNQCFIYEAPVIRVDNDVFMNYEEANKWLDKLYP